MYETIVDCKTVSRYLDDPDWVIVDCRFDLAATESGRRAYAQAHVPGAVYAHLDHDLSGPPATDHGRHPLPTPAAMAGLFGRIGIHNHSQVVVYDDSGGMIAGRLWWMLRYMGHSAVALLEGGWAAWKAGGFPTRSGHETHRPVTFTGTPAEERLIIVDDVLRQALLVDARDEERYAGRDAGPDPLAGHIPGARNYPFTRNLTADNLFLPAATLREQLSDIFGDIPSDAVTFYCGSGVSACLNILAQVHAGLPEGKLYVGSWSEWSRENRPIEVSP